MNHQQQTGPDALGYNPKIPTDAERQRASAWTAVLSLPNEAAVVIAQQIEAEARQKVILLDPTDATEAQMRCALAVWKHARNAFTEAQGIVATVQTKTDRAMEAQRKLSTNS